MYLSPDNRFDRHNPLLLAEPAASRLVRTRFRRRGCPSRLSRSAQLDYVVAMGKNAADEDVVTVELLEDRVNGAVRYLVRGNQTHQECSHKQQTNQRSEHPI